MASGMQKALAIIGGLLVGGGVTYMAYQISGEALAWPDEYWIGAGVVVTIFAGMSIYFLTKGGGSS